MRPLRTALGAALFALIAQAVPADAQFYFKPRDLSGPPVQGDEPGLLQAMPGATPAELRAEMVWSLRAALNVAALQCDFEPTLATVRNYNHMLVDHSAELAQSFATLTAYYRRTARTAAAGQSALDTFGTRTYSGYTSVRAQLTFCTVMGPIGRDVAFTPRGQLHEIAANRLREVRNAGVSYGEQYFEGGTRVDLTSSLRLDPRQLRRAH